VARGGPRRRAVRSDTLRYREALLEGAVRAFERDGVDVPLDEVAREAGVSIATLFRHFPSREALIAEVYMRDIDALCDTVDSLLKRLPPDEALSTWMQRFATYVCAKSGMAAAARTILLSAGDESPKPSTAKAHAAMARMLDEGQRAGLLRPGFTTDDVLRALGGICIVTDRPDRRAQARKLVATFVDGLRTSPRPS
jgi:AcrR family transcriptional regulator